LSIAKLKKVFGHLKLQDVKGMHEEYLKTLELDSKPEKGERKLADDWVLIINEVLDKDFKCTADSVALYRISILEYALEKSPYNFDIQLQLLILYDQLGLSPSFQQALTSLNIKGV
jgi:hypothetical protein